jgi:hypothetical protein
MGLEEELKRKENLECGWLDQILGNFARPKKANTTSRTLFSSKRK